MLQARIQKQEGFTLIELMIVMIIIAMLLAMLLPSLNTYLLRSKQTSVVTTANSLGNACVPWLLNNGGVATLSNPVECVGDYPQALTRDEMSTLLAPNYIKMIPEFDAWGYPWQYNFSGNLAGPQVLCLRSPGRDGTFDSDSYTIGPFVATDYDRDVVWADGSLVRWPSVNGQ